MNAPFARADQHSYSAHRTLLGQISTLPVLTTVLSIEPARNRPRSGPGFRRGLHECRLSGRVGTAGVPRRLRPALSFRYRIDASHRRATIVVEGIVSPKAFGEAMDKLFRRSRRTGRSSTSSTIGAPFRRSPTPGTPIRWSPIWRPTGNGWRAAAGPWSWVLEVQGGDGGGRDRRTVSTLVGIEARTFLRLEDANAWLDREDGKEGKG